MGSLGKPLRFVRARLAELGSAPLRYAYLGNDTAILTTRADLRMLVDTRDRALTPHLATTGRWEPDVERTLDRLLRRGQRVVEVGANIGYHTLTMAKRIGPTGHIDAFEPNPHICGLLRDTIFLNGFNAIVTVHECAALDRAGPVKFQFNPRFGGGGNVVVPGYEDPTNQHFEVAGVRLDDVLSAEPPVDLLRMDAEGSEALVLWGGEQLLRRSPGVRIVMEFAPGMLRPRGEVREFAGWLASLGFKAWRIEPSGALAKLAMAELAELPHCEIVLSRDVPPGARRSGR